jgi:hypothetical protein
VGGERPHVTVTVPIDALRPSTNAPAERTPAPGRTSALADVGPELDHTGPTPSATVRQLTCDAALMRVVLSGRSQPLDVGDGRP